MDTTTILIIVAIATHIIAGFFTFGIVFAHFQRGWPTIAKEQRKDDMGVALFFALLGVLGFFVTLLCSGFAKYGLLYPWNKN